MDRKIVISDLKDIAEILIKNGYGGWAVSIGEAISLLKEQQETIENLGNSLNSQIKQIGWEDIDEDE